MRCALFKNSIDSTLPEFTVILRKFKSNSFINYYLILCIFIKNNIFTFIKVKKNVKLRIYASENLFIIFYLETCEDTDT